MVLGLHEYLERLKGKIRDGIFFFVNKSDNYNVQLSRVVRNKPNQLLRVLAGEEQPKFGYRYSRLPTPKNCLSLPIFLPFRRPGNKVQETEVG